MEWEERASRDEESYGIRLGRYLFDTQRYHMPRDEMDRLVTARCMEVLFFVAMIRSG